MTALTIDWQDEAACRGMDQSIFFPDSGPGRPPDYRPAAAVCLACPVLRACRLDVLRAEKGVAGSNRHGFVAGLTPNGRAALDIAEPTRCAVCDELYVSQSGAKVCSQQCRKVYMADYNRDWQRANRNNGRPNPVAAHGSITMAHSGCGCFACSNRRRSERRRMRATSTNRAPVEKRRSR